MNTTTRFGAVVRPQQQHREAGEERHVERGEGRRGDVPDVALGVLRRRATASSRTRSAPARRPWPRCHRRTPRRRWPRHPTASGTTGTRIRSGAEGVGQLPDGEHDGGDHDADERGLPDVQGQQDHRAETRARRRSPPAGCGRPGCAAPAAAPPASGRARAGSCRPPGRWSWGDPGAEPQTSRSSASLCLSSSSTGRDVLLGDLLELLLGAGHVVLADLAVLGQPVQLVLGVPADVADRDPRVLGLLVRDLDELLAALLGELRERRPG